jgi:stage V sporulation protein R
VDDGALLEFYQSHTGVVNQLDYDHKYYSGINPYALGFAMYRDIERIATDPTEEDRDWFGDQSWVGCGDYLAAIDFAITGFKDESFIQQFLSPKVIRDFKLFAIHDDEVDPKYLISAIHNKQGYKTVRDVLAKQYNFGYIVPDIQVVKVDRWHDRTMTLNHYMVNGRPLEAENTTETLKKIAFLWGYGVRLQSVDENHQLCASYEVLGNETLMDVFLDDNKN